MSEMTTEILEQNIGKIVLVRLKGGKSLRGRLKGFDQHLNLVLEETEDTTLFHHRLGDRRGKRHTINGQAPRKNCPHHV
jgi:small nuclear ribonucleoprotein (snRNP)-like protein